MTNEQLVAEFERIQREYPDAVLPKLEFADEDTLNVVIPDGFSADELLRLMIEQGANVAKQ